MKSLKLLFPLVMVMILVAGCSPSAKAPATNPELTNMPAVNNPAPYGDTGAVVSNQLAIEIKGFAFNPQNATVKVGTTVTWTNKDSAPHTVTADDHSFDSGVLDQGQSFTFQFTTPGTYPYTCTNHPSMQATIIVVQ